MSYAVGSNTARVIHPELINYFARRTPSTAIAEELAQETWLSIGEYRADGPLRGFLFHVAFTVLADWYRQQNRRRRDVVYLEDSYRPVQASRSWGTRLQAYLDKQVMLRAINALSEPFRRTLIMTLRGLGSDELARREGVSRATIRSRLARARERMRRLLLGE